MIKKSTPPAIRIKQVVSFLYYNTGLAYHRYSDYASSENSLILMYHRIVPTRVVTTELEPGMYVTAETFARHIAFLAKHFTIVPLADLFSVQSEPGKPRCAITFDDGWHDFLLHAFLVLERFQAPSTVFLPTNFIGTEKEFWTDTVARLLSREQELQQALALVPFKDKLSSNIVVQQMARANMVGEKKLEFVISGLKNRRAPEIYAALEELRGIFPAIIPDGRVFLDWDEIHRLRASGLVSFGSHTVDHNILTTLQPDEIRQELILSKEKLSAQGAVSREEPIFFCYPNGNASSEIALMVKEAGYAGAVTTKKGWNGSEANIFLLNRVGLHEDISSTQAMFACRLAGIF